MIKRESDPDLEVIGSRFRIPGAYQSGAPYGKGHINDTFIVIYGFGASTQRYIFQRINQEIFRNPVSVMENFKRITSHISGILSEAGEEEIERRVLNLVATRDGDSFAFDESGAVWRATRYIANTFTKDQIDHNDLAFEAGRCYGEYQRQLLSLDASLLHETIADFHNTRVRYDNLVATIEADNHNRAQWATAEITFATSREPSVDCISGLMHSGLLPVRIAHNDTKINNLLFDQESRKALCVTDLDTTMPGTIVHDFGDMVRTGTISSHEDEPSPDQVTMRLDLFESLTEGYLASVGSFITETELHNLVPASELIVLEIGMRFLADYLDGDVYFKTQRQEHNLHRCRVQFKLLESIEKQRESMLEIVESLWNEVGASDHD